MLLICCPLHHPLSWCKSKFTSKCVTLYVKAISSLLSYLLFESTVPKPFGSSYYFLPLDTHWLTQCFANMLGAVYNLKPFRGRKKLHLRDTKIYGLTTNGYSFFWFTPFFGGKLMLAQNFGFLVPKYCVCCYCIHVLYHIPVHCS